ncbi:hypothetical protein LUZ62_050292 [Rhynchospora pubera]|uniref:Uncharacterized protein n=1 Tax=Rhynchospora pubera TaxID=906938 RepID=A0AAV8G703_9POAL|nr:hypothetical protein LUZ62_050292 [Rhynchospora pubera]
MLENIPKRTLANDPFTISRIPPFIRDNHKDFYEPQMVPIGPYHHNEERFHEMEEHKRHYLHDFLERNSQVNAGAYINAVKNVMKNARDYYHEPIQLSDNKFVEMLLLDGCFILELILKLGNDKHRSLCWARWDFMSILSDLLLIENQIPFFVLEKLYAVNISNSLDGCKNPVDSDLKSLVVNNLFVKYFGDNLQTSRVQRLFEGPVHHLLHLYHELSLPNPETRKECYTASSHRQKNHRLPLVIPSATRLFELGFVLRKQDSIKNCEVTFKRSNKIRIPHLIVDSTRQALLMNLLAFEHGLEETKCRWTGLMVMMNCLVKDKKDLEILQRSGIVLNLLPSEDEMIQFFSQLSKQVASDFSDHYFRDLFEQINLSCETYFRQKRAMLMHEYFNNPWAVISFVSSMVAIFLSTVQTLVSVYTYRRVFN